MATVTLTGMDLSETHFLQYKFRCYGFNGRNRMRKFDGVSFKNAGITRAEFVPTVATATLSPSLTGTYYYFVVPVNSKHFTMNGRKVAGLPSFISAGVSPNAQGVLISNIPATHADGQVDYWQIFRNVNGYFDPQVDPSAQDFYLVAEIPIGTTSYSDNIPDSYIVQQERMRFNTNIPPTCRYGFVFGERLWQFNFPVLNTGTATRNASGTALTVTNKQLTSNVATLTLSVPHQYSVGDSAIVSGVDATFNGTFTVLSTPTRFTFTYAKVAGDVASTAATGSVNILDLIDFSSVSLPDGVVGCWFQADADSKRYRIRARPSTTQIQIERAYPTSLSASVYAIFRDGYELYASEFGDPEANGPVGEAYRYKVALPGYDTITAGIPYLDNAMIFSATNIYMLSGVGPNMDRDITLSKSPIYQGLGCVGGNALCVVDNTIFFISQRGPAMLQGGSPQLIGEQLNTSAYLDSLTAAERGLCAVGSSYSGRFIYFSFPVSGETENSLTFRYDRVTQAWWPVSGMNPFYFFNDDGQSGISGTGYYIQGKNIIQPDSGTRDLTSTDYNGLVGANTTTTMADASATFATTNGGLVECYVHFYRTTAGVQSYLTSRRITSNTGTQITWASSGTGGGTLALNSLTDVYRIGTIRWYWKTRTFQIPGHTNRVDTSEIEFESFDRNSPTKSVLLTQYTDGSAFVTDQVISCNEPKKTIDVFNNGSDYAQKLESYNGAQVRQITIRSTVDGEGAQ